MVCVALQSVLNNFACVMNKYSTLGNDNHNDNYCIVGYIRMVEMFVFFVISVEHLRKIKLQHFFGTIGLTSLS